VVSENLNWTDAGQRCRSLHKDAHLLVINDAAEQSAVAAMLSSVDRQCQVLSHVRYRKIDTDIVILSVCPSATEVSLDTSKPIPFPPPFRSRPP